VNATSKPAACRRNSVVGDDAAETDSVNDGRSGALLDQPTPSSTRMIAVPASAVTPPATAYRRPSSTTIRIAPANIDHHTAVRHPSVTSVRPSTIVMTTMPATTATPRRSARETLRRRIASTP